MLIHFYIGDMIVYGQIDRTELKVVGTGRFGGISVSDIGNGRFCFSCVASREKGQRKIQRKRAKEIQTILGLRKRWRIFVEVEADFGLFQFLKWTRAAPVKDDGGSSLTYRCNCRGFMMTVIQMMMTMEVDYDGSDWERASTQVFSKRGCIRGIVVIPIPGPAPKPPGQRPPGPSPPGPKPPGNKGCSPGWKPGPFSGPPWWKFIST
ncbi:hypothetical protein HNY73_009762 [Argiope bruennichi]|uniref:Uncharacterized protein n=1 Tax=Argiope bruennichi TaxID=94029 RepID=A0A8T0FD34_ARGBR|nr:hypothetical protein HNY73_009762 [Argiope bruennichi]